MASLIVVHVPTLVVASAASVIPVLGLIAVFLIALPFPLTSPEEPTPGTTKVPTLKVVALFHYKNSSLICKWITQEN